MLRSTSANGPFYYIATATSNSYQDSSVVGGNTYYYEVEAYVWVNVSNGGTVGQMSLPSLPVKVILSAPPAAPANLLGVPGNGLVTLSWSASAMATSYNVYRATANAGPYTKLANVSTTSYLDRSVTNGTMYYYYVTAVNASGESSNSNHFATTPFAPPTAPSGLNAVGGKGNITLSWKTVPQASFYYVLRSTASTGGYSPIVTTVGTSFTDTNVVKGVKYYYEVAAYVNINGAGMMSPDSSPVSAASS